MDPAIYRPRAAERPFNFADIVAPMPLGLSPDQRGRHVTMGGRDWDVRIGNGHAPEHATLWAATTIW
jgi:glyoxylase-like metal-dependent hydrolase (beta-lactamase superfamily II)